MNATEHLWWQVNTDMIDSANGLVPSYGITRPSEAELFWDNLVSTMIPTVLINSLRPRQNGRQFGNDTYKCIFLNGNAWIPIKISLKFVPKCRINNILALVQIMAWRRPGDKPLAEPMIVGWPTHICVTRPQWVKHLVWFQQPARFKISMSRDDTRYPGNIYLCFCPTF